MSVGVAAVVVVFVLRAFYRSAKNLVPADVTGDDVELTPEERAMRTASASGFDFQ